MKLLVRTAIVAMTVATLPSLGFAQPDPTRNRGERACGRDARQLCRAVINQGDMVMLSCLQTNEKKLSKACHKFLVDQGQLWPDSEGR
jgi:hypothetical protein